MAVPKFRRIWPELRAPILHRIYIFSLSKISSFVKDTMYSILKVGRIYDLGPWTFFSHFIVLWLSFPELLNLSRPYLNWNYHFQILFLQKCAYLTYIHNFTQKGGGDTILHKKRSSVLLYGSLKTQWRHTVLCNWAMHAFLCFSCFGT